MIIERCLQQVTCLILLCVLPPDIDECSVTGMCINGQCVNEMGTYRCDCDKDFMPNLARTGCIGNVAINLTERHDKKRVAFAVRRASEILEALTDFVSTLKVRFRHARCIDKLVKCTQVPRNQQDAQRAFTWDAIC